MINRTYFCAYKAIPNANQQADGSFTFCVKSWLPDHTTAVNAAFAMAKIRAQTEQLTLVSLNRI